MHHIRPHQVLKIEDSYDEAINFFMPSPLDGGVSVIESIMLLKLMRCVDPAHIFEFGTYSGKTTRLFLDNIKDNGATADRIYTLDLPDLEGVSFQATDKLLAERSMSLSRKYTLSPRRSWVTQIYQDSMYLDVSPYLRKFQFIFIDANHEQSYVQKDTENAFKMVASEPACIAWHDYGNPLFGGLTQYLDDLSNDVDLYHIEDTMLVFRLFGKKVAPKGSWP